MGAGAPGVAHQEGQHVELLGGERHRLAGAARLVVHEVDDQVARGELGRLVGVGAGARADGRADPRLELGQGERLGHVVVGAAVEGGDLAVLGAVGAEAR